MKYSDNKDSENTSENLIFRILKKEPPQIIKKRGNSIRRKILVKKNI